MEDGSMSSRRSLVLMAVLLLMLGLHLGRTYWQTPGPQFTPPPPEPLLAGENSISNLVVKQRDDGQWQVSFDYFNRGQPAWIEADIDSVRDKDVFTRGVARMYELKRGSNHGSVTLYHPGIETSSRQVIVRMVGQDQTQSMLATARVDQLIDWPHLRDYQEVQAFAKHSPEENFERAVTLIDANDQDSLRQAKVILERLIQQDAAFDAGYIELARVAMKTNWGPEGWHHAEGLLSSALQIKPDSVNAKILLGYVYTHQKRFKPAEKLFAEAVASNPPNIWLWANWGEALAMQGKYDQAIAKYKEAVARPTSTTTYERARADAYTKLLALLERKKDLDGMEALYKSGLETFGYSSCHTLNYARFKLQQRGDSDGAIEILRKALDAHCSFNDARELMGLAQYVAWSKREGAAKLEALNQARIYLPPGARAIYLLAGSEHTVKAAAQLVSSGENIDNKDNDKLSALAHAVQNEETATARRLLRMGASPLTPVSYNDLPVALMPVMSGNLELVKLMRESGADYAKITYQGATAFDFAKQTGDPDLLQALEPTPRTL
jgi:tetratricopeptide (TPR) repeat protein